MQDIFNNVRRYGGRLLDWLHYPSLQEERFYMTTVLKEIIRLQDKTSIFHRNKKKISKMKEKSFLNNESVNECNVSIYEIKQDYITLKKD